MHVAISYDVQTGSAKIYQNGVLVEEAFVGFYNPSTGWTGPYPYATETMPPNFASVSTLFIGGGHDWNQTIHWPSLIRGVLADIRIYGRVLSDQEIRGIVHYSVNYPPIANPQEVIVQEDQPQTIALTGSDLDEDPLEFFVTEGPLHGTLSGDPPDLNYTPSANFFGSDSFTFKVRDSNDAESEPAVVAINVQPVNDAPTVDAGPDQSFECQGILTLVTLFASGYDIDGDPLQYTWYEGENYLGSGQSLEVALVLGPHEITVKVTDPYPASGFDTVTVTIVDTTPPVIDSISASPNILWPVNHKMVPIQVMVIASDNDGVAPVSRIISVTCNEPVNALGDGNTSVDWEITGDLTVNLRAERSGKGNGRIYMLLIECRDTTGNVSQHQVTVAVPQNMTRN